MPSSENPTEATTIGDLSKIWTCQLALAALLTDDEYFSGAANPDVDPPIEASMPLTVIAQRKGNIVNEVEQKILRATGAGVIVQLPLVTCEDSAHKRLNLGLKFACIVTENPIVNQGPNGSGKPAEAICERVATLLHQQPNGVSTGASRIGFFSLDRNAIRMMEPIPGSELLLNYIVAINTEIVL